MLSSELLNCDHFFYFSEFFFFFAGLATVSLGDIIETGGGVGRNRRDRGQVLERRKEQESWGRKKKPGESETLENWRIGIVVTIREKNSIREEF